MKSKSETYTIDGVSDERGYELTMACMRNIGFTEEEIDQIWQIIVAILNLGNVSYRVDSETDEAHINDEARASVIKAGELLQF